MITAAKRYIAQLRSKNLLVRSISVVIVIFASGLTASVHAQNRPLDAWNWTIAPYLWGAGLSGTAATVPRLPPVDVDASFSDILENLEFGGMVAIQGNSGRFGFAGDVQYIALSSTGSTPGTSFSSATVDTTNTIMTLMGEYQLNTNATSELWVGGGVRYWSVQTDLTFAAGTLPTQASSSKDSWFDPIVGLRGRTDLGEKVFLTGWAYAGGFGAGSDEMIDLFGGVGYKFSDNISGIAGYRWMSVDRVNDSFTYDMKQEGMLAGVTFNF